jgi:hypothetical protein
MVYAPKTTTALTIDQNQAKIQLDLLGYKPGENIYLTAFFPKGDPRTKGENRDKGRKANRLNYAEVEAWQAEGRGVYLVVNGYGHGKDDVKNCRAIFYEHDDLEKKLQLNLWQSLGLPEPTVQVDTGGKSIHSYWVLDQPIHPELWAFDEGKSNRKGLQADLLKYANADQALVNPNRVMRLAGCWYMVNDESGTHAVAQSRIVGGCNKRYSYAELRGIIPRSEPPEIKQTRRSHHNDSLNTGEGLLDFRTVADLLPHWNDRGRSGWATFQCPVHTTSGKHSDDHIHVNLNTGAWEAHCGCNRKIIYQTVCDTVGHKPTGHGYSGGIGGGNRRNFGGGSGSGGGDDGNKGNVVQFPASSQSSPLDFVKYVLAEKKTKAERDSAFIASGYNVRDLSAIARELEKEEDANEERQEAKDALPRLLQKSSLNPHDYLWGDEGQLAQAIVNTAIAMPTSPSRLMTTLLPVAATLIGTSSRVVVKPSAKYKQPCIIWSGVVGRSGELKSPSQQVIIDALVRLEIDAATQFEQELEDYKIAHAHWKKDKGDPEDEPKLPIRKRYLTEDATLETLERIHGQNPRGVLVYRDELAGDFKAENSHRGGRGADREAKLSQFNGREVIVDRKEREIILQRSAISRTGSIQWEVLQSLMGEHDDSAGVFARWIFDCAESPPRFISFDDEPDTGIDNLLTNLYKRLELMPQADYLLNSEAKEAFLQWQNYLVNRELRESGGLQLVFPKIEAYTARFALWLHVVNAALAGETPAPTIDGCTMSRAIEMAQYYLSQYELIMAVNSPQAGLTGVLLKIFNYLKEKPDGTTIGKLKAGIRSLRGVDKTEVQSHCHWLVENGYAVLDGKKIKSVDTVDKKLTPLSTAEPLIHQGVERKVDKVDKLTNHSSHPMGITKDAVSVAPPTVDAVNFCNLSTDHLETTVNQGVDVVDKKVDTSTTSVNFSQEDLLALEQAAPTSADNCGASVVDTPVVDATPNPSPLPQKPSIEVVDSTPGEEAIAPSAQLAQELATTGDELSQTEPDFDQFPHTNPRAAWGVKKSKAEQIKREILNITGAVDFFALQDDPRYSTNELNWVRKNLLTKQQRNALTATIKKTAMEIQ